MRCGCYVKHETTPKGRERTNVVSWWHTTDAGVGGTFSTGQLLDQGYEICQGRVKVTIKAEDEPYYGGSSASLSIEYICDSCGWMFHPQLPQNGEDLSRMLTRALVDYDDNLDRYGAKATELENRARREEALVRLRENPIPKRKVKSR